MSNKILVIGGPTACGKTQISFEIAKKINGEIISCDSRQFYKEINIGTDKPSLSMREKIPHHFIDFLSLKEEFDVYQFSNMVFEKVKEIISKGKIPIIVGGSG
ncbi:MAG: tRNA (adenosine(37)-N6)-dimethylallyltransferase MiaA, partial [Candidatus Omnitrophica bacterium]|nr:tRNA (adenosine(37)-N6)-dimethylallyltransferase MiaA [Candidatus Omnitrophota bacterium]